MYFSGIYCKQHGPRSRLIRVHSGIASMKKIIWSEFEYMQQEVKCRWHILGKKSPINTSEFCDSKCSWKKRVGISCESSDSRWNIKSYFVPGRVAQSVTCLATDASLTADPGVASSIPAQSHIFYGHSPPFRWIIQEGLLSVTSKSMYTKYWLTACSSLPRKKVWLG